MIQRIQSIWLLLASVCAFAGLHFSFYSGSVDQSQSMVFLNGMYNFPISFLTIAIGTISSVNIFIYKNRKLQIRFCVFTLLLELLLLFLYWTEIKKFSIGTLSLSSALQIFVLFFSIMSLLGVYKDKKIVEESSRLR
jgi:ABC-type dipeptide/oligopeptide/nickel transport system permease subunit